MGASTKETKIRIQSLARGNAILAVIEKHGVATLASITRQTGLNKTTAFYLLESLVGLGFVERLDQARGFQLGLRNLELGKAVQRRMSIIETAKPSLTKLCLATRETVNLAVPYLLDALIVESLEGSHGVRVTSYAGTRAPYHATACGKVILAYLDEASRHAIYNSRGLDAITPRTLTSVAALEAQLAEIRRVGHGFDLEEMEDSAHCVAAPVVDAFGKVAAAVSIAGPKSRTTTESLTAIASLIKAETAEISKRLGGGKAASLARTEKPITAG
jgi:IclR family acetate operon transcriptional repressor